MILSKVTTNFVAKFYPLFKHIIYNLIKECECNDRMINVGSGYFY